jgi:hypothetical protein
MQANSAHNNHAIAHDLVVRRRFILPKDKSCSSKLPAVLQGGQIEVHEILVNRHGAEPTIIGENARNSQIKVTLPRTEVPLVSNSTKCLIEI